MTLQDRHPIYDGELIRECLLQTDDYPNLHIVAAGAGYHPHPKERRGVAATASNPIMPTSTPPSIEAHPRKPDAKAAGVALVLNAGSSSLRFAAFDRSTDASPKRVLTGKVERIGLPNPTMTFKRLAGGPSNGGDGAAEQRSNVAARDPAEAASAVMEALRHANDGRPKEEAAVAVVGHRVVHGGPNYTRPQRVTPQLLDELRRISPLDPDHLPDEIALIEAFGQKFPGVPQVACFDTAFHSALPRVAKMLALPRRLEAQGVRRYGFHGLSYTYLMGELNRLIGPEKAAGRIILAHLGNGASLAAISGGRCVDTSMGLTPAAGIPMGTRSGDIDPGLIRYLAATEGMKPDAFDDMVNRHSGLLGVSETTSDMRELLELEAADVRAHEAIELFCYQAKKWVGSFAAALGGVDVLVFAGGIGEKSSPVRERICATLGFLGIRIDPARNQAHAPVISPDGGSVEVRVIPTDEEQVIADASVALMATRP